MDGTVSRSIIRAKWLLDNSPLQYPKSSSVYRIKNRGIKYDSSTTFDFQSDSDVSEYEGNVSLNISGANFTQDPTDPQWPRATTTTAEFYQRQTWEGNDVTGAGSSDLLTNVPDLDSQNTGNVILRSDRDEDAAVDIAFENDFLLENIPNNTEDDQLQDYGEDSSNRLFFEGDDQSDRNEITHSTLLTVRDELSSIAQNLSLRSKAVEQREHVLRTLVSRLTTRANMIAKQEQEVYTAKQSLQHEKQLLAEAIKQLHTQMSMLNERETKIKSELDQRVADRCQSALQTAEEDIAAERKRTSEEHRRLRLAYSQIRCTNEMLRKSNEELKINLKQTEENLLHSNRRIAALHTSIQAIRQSRSTSQPLATHNIQSDGYCMSAQSEDHQDSVRLKTHTVDSSSNLRQSDKKKEVLTELQCEKDLNHCTLRTFSHSVDTERITQACCTLVSILLEHCNAHDVIKSCANVGSSSSFFDKAFKSTNTWLTSAHTSTQRPCPSDKHDGSDQCEQDSTTAYGPRHGNNTSQPRLLHALVTILTYLAGRQHDEFCSGSKMLTNNAMISDDIDELLLLRATHWCVQSVTRSPHHNRTYHGSLSRLARAVALIGQRYRKVVEICHQNPTQRWHRRHPNRSLLHNYSLQCIVVIILTQLQCISQADTVARLFNELNTILQQPSAFHEFIHVQGLDVLRKWMLTAIPPMIQSPIDLLLLLCLGHDKRDVSAATISSLLCTRPWLQALKRAAEVCLQSKGNDPAQHDISVLEKILIVCEHIAKQEPTAKHIFASAGMTEQILLYKRLYGRSHHFLSATTSTILSIISENPKA